MKTICASVKEYLTVRRSLGYKLRSAEKHLYGFAAFLRRKRSPHITTALAIEWATESPLAARSHHAGRLSAVRLFATYRKIADPRTEVPPSHLMPYRPKRATVHIYTLPEIQAVITALRNSHPSTLKNQTFSTLFGLLAVSGCRSGELLKLSCADVDFKRKRLVIRFAKHGAMRLIPLHTSTINALRRYSRLRNAFFGDTETFFVSTVGAPVAYCDFERTFLRISKNIGLRSANAKRGPRIHDLRHTFAVRAVLRWYRRKLSVEERIPILSAYLGHIKPSDTYWYLTGVPELLSLAAARLPNFRR